MNEENNMDVEQSNEKDISSIEVSGVDDKQEVHTSEPNEVNQEATQDYIELLGQVQQVNQKMDNITNLSIVCMVGIGMIIGIISCNIFSRYFKS